MFPSFGPASGLMSAVLCLLLLLPAVVLAHPNPNIVQRESTNGAARPLFYEHKHQRIYRNDDPEIVLVREPTDGPQANFARGAGSPRIQATKVLGISPANPAMEFINVQGSQLPTLPSPLYAPKINTVLTTSPLYSPMYNGSGSVTLDAATMPYVQKLQARPSLHRDNGLGGKIGNHNLFVFADTMSFTQTGQWTGFVSNSVASNGGSQVKAGEAPVLHDKMGEWASNMGTMRNFIPFTEGEAAFNAKMAGLGQRYAIWPMSSLINIDRDSALLYAPILFTNSKHGKSMNFINYVGMTVVKVTVPSRAGAVAKRIIPMLFSREPGVEWGVEWGAVGGIRGEGNNIYILGNHKGGLLLGRVDVNQAADSSAYEFWHSDGTWSSARPTNTSKDNFVDFAISNCDIFYSPRHSTFIMVYMTPYADNKFYWSYLQAPTPIKPTGTGDYVEEITKHKWSDPVFLINLPMPPGGSYAYAGGMHRGYFNDQDITNGGNKMLLSWTQPNGLAASSPQTGYYHMTAEVTFD